MYQADMKQDIARFSGGLEELRKNLKEVVLAQNDKKVDKINEDVVTIDVKVDGSRSILGHKTK